MKEEAKKEVRAIALDLAETVGEHAVEAVFKIVEVVINDTDNKIDDVALQFMPKIKEKVLELVQKINKED